ncbi:TlpA family protein disulfide reductase [Streptomyces sp. HUAS TT20]|uniref:TlpA family protein disulfide reductase n=1 Tax=Streptomyces sp. HUAS TT20 TaxID=3447509 RepID=UPI0021D94A5F|nr:TlpA disulfide reductase family protein [Streptomyces sp. HUAS 15-9]UXY28872.1 TlpA family protein disulfide reductase [Streptomyces sp. HUAS 15-9]
MTIKRTGWAAACAAALVSGCTSAHSSTNDATVKDGVSSWPVSSRQAMPVLQGDGADGRPVRLDAFKGKVVVLNAWASWCGPCRVESPGLARIQKALGKQGLQVVGLDGGDSASNALSFIRDHDLNYPTLMDEHGKQALRIPRGTVSQVGLPYTVFLDRKGRIAASVSGGITEQQVRKIVTPLLADR